MTSAIHRSALVQAAIEHGIILPEQGDELFRAMWYTNRLALYYRYGDEHPDELECDERQAVEAPLRVEQIVHNIGCFDYQCAEFSGYDEMPATRTMEALRLHLLRTKLGMSDEEWNIWRRGRSDDFVWGIDKWSDVIDFTKMGVSSGT